MRHVKLRISGKVQGVGFRYSAKKMAEKLGLTGWIKNEKDGNVSAEVEGDEDSVESFIRWAKKGPRSADVRGLNVKEGEEKGFNSFEIRN